MSTSVARRTRQAPVQPEHEPRAVDVAVTGGMLHVYLSDGREVGAPIAWFPRLAAATPAERSAWQIETDGYGIHWEKIDEDISVKGLLSGWEER